MTGDAGVLDHLNRYLRTELTGHKQYMLHAGLCHRWGYGRLAERQREYSAEEVRHANRVLERVLFLDGAPDVQDLRPLDAAPTVPEQLEQDHALVSGAIALLRDAIARSIAAADGASRVLFEEMLVDEERHLHWLEAQLHLIRQLGPERYLAEQM